MNHFENSHLYLFLSGYNIIERQIIKLIGPKDYSWVTNNNVAGVMNAHMMIDVKSPVIEILSLLKIQLWYKLK